ncbi:MAG: gliding motility-associated C-terminal domain-containing protein [Bacteroidetes bacterium]|nr:gliding motility-associated C-terminal domain-containing protein [Bacteroidota bacterium]
MFAQKEANWWHFGNHIAMNFSAGNPVYSYSSSISVTEACATISDNTGNLLFYTNGDTVWDKNNNIMPNGTNLLTQAGFNASAFTTTQGAMILKKPKSLDHYYIFTLGTIWDNALEYAEIDMSANFGNGIVLTKNNLLIADTLTEKMTATKHCNNSDLWTVVVNWDNVEPNGKNNTCSFLSYLVSQSGINPQPIVSSITLPESVMAVGQMKFNPQGNILAWASPNGIELFNFNSETGIVKHNSFIPLPLNNGYGMEFSSDGKKIYVNEKQYDLVTGTLTSLLKYDVPAQLQMAQNGKIYKYHFPKAEILSIGSANTWQGSVSINNAFRLTEIKFPDLIGVSCTFDTAFIYDYSYNFSGYSLGLPNFPSFYFHHPVSEFQYNGVCVGTPFSFYLSDPTVSADSVKWMFYDNNQSMFGNTAVHTYSFSGSNQVECIVFNGGVGDTTIQCVTVCGAGYSVLPRHITLCKGTDTIINGVSPCGVGYRWNTGDTLSAISIDQEGVYVLQTNGFCGSYFDTVFVNTVYCDPDFEIPNVFTPNGDGANDVFSIRLKNIESISYEIYNRWGNLLKSKSVAVNVTNWQHYDMWDGKKDDGSQYSDGTYFYVLLMKDFKGREIKEKGFFSLFNNE